MTGNFSFDKINCDFNPKDCGEVAKTFRENLNTSVGQFAAILDLSPKYITGAESGNMNSFIYLYKVMTHYSNVRIKMKILC